MYSSTSVRVLWVLVLLGLLTECKRRRPIELSDDGEPVAAAPRPASQPGPAAGAAKPAGVQGAISAVPPVLPRAALIEREPEKAPAPSLGFPIPADLKLQTRSTKSEVFESQYSVKALERFYRRELGRDGALEPRTYGFRATLTNSNGFLLVTHPPGADTVRIAVIGNAARPARVLDRQSETPQPPPPDPTPTEPTPTPTPTPEAK